MNGKLLNWAGGDVSSLHVTSFWFVGSISLTSIYYFCHFWLYASFHIEFSFMEFLHFSDGLSLQLPKRTPLDI